MTDPEKLFRGNDPLLRQMIEAGRSEIPGHESVRRMLAGVGVSAALVAVKTAQAAGAGLASAVSSGSLATATVLAAAKWTLLGLAAGALTSGAASVLVTETSPAVHTLLEQRAPARSAPPASLPAVARVALAAPPSVARPASRSETPRGIRTAQRPASAELGKEVLLVDLARGALARGDLTMVVRLTEEHQARFPRAQLADAVAYLRMEALERSGHQDEARGVAERLLEANPRGVHALRARAIMQAER